MGSDKFPIEQRRIIKSMEQELARLGVLARQRPPIHITKAAGSFNVPSGSVDDPDDGATIYSDGDGFGIRTASGKDIRLPMSDVSNPPNFGSPSTQTGEFASGSAYTQLRADCAALHDTVRDLMNEMRSAGWMD